MNYAFQLPALRRTGCRKETIWEWGRAGALADVDEKGADLRNGRCTWYTYSNNPSVDAGNIIGPGGMPGYIAIGGRKSDHRSQADIFRFAQTHQKIHMNPAKTRTRPEETIRIHRWPSDHR
jgi:hypothetical protein